MSSFVLLGFARRMLATSDILRGAVRLGVRRRLAAPLDCSLRDGQSRPPAQVNIKVTNACNLRCKMCAQWGTSGYNLTRPPGEVRRVLPLETYQALVDDIRAFKPWIYVWGGEPFLYPDILPLLAYIKEAGLVVSVLSNGTRMAKHADQLVDMGCDVLIFSIDGPRDTHDTLRGLNGAFDAAVSSVKSIQAQKARRDCPKPYIVIQATVAGDNQRDLDGVFHLAEELAVDGVMVNYGWFQTAESGHRYVTVMQDRLDTTPWSWRGWLWGVEEIEPHVVRETVKRIKGRDWGFPVKFVPDLKYNDILRYYQEHDHTFGHRRCVAPWVKAEIMPNGDVVTCAEYPDYVVGNIQEESLRSIWNGERARKFRSVLKSEGGLLPVCSRCPGLLGW